MTSIEPKTTDSTSANTFTSSGQGIADAADRIGKPGPTTGLADIDDLLGKHTDKTKKELEESEKTLNKSAKGIKDITRGDKDDAGNFKGSNPSRMGQPMGSAAPTASPAPTAATAAPVAPPAAAAAPAMVPASMGRAISPEALSALLSNAGVTPASVEKAANSANGHVPAGLRANSSDSSRIKVAKEIIAEGVRRGLPFEALQIAIATAMTESEMQVLANASVPDSMMLPHDGVGSDHDSVGPFQQRQSWGATADLMDPTKSAGKFYDRLMKVDGWQNMSVAQAAQAVQRSALPDAYAKNEARAAAMVRTLLGQGA